MATIPRTQPRVIQGRAVPIGGQLSTAQAQAMAGIGSTLASTGLDMMAQETRQRLQEQQRHLDEETARQRSAATLAVKRGRLDLDTAMEGISQRVLTGDLDEAGARNEWQAQTGRVLEKQKQGLPRELAQHLGDELALQADALAAGRLPEALRNRRQGETKANLLQTLELFERDAVHDRPKAVAKAQEFVATLGPTAGMGPEQQHLTLQRFKEKTAANLAERLMNEAGDSLPVLDALKGRLSADDFADLSPDTRERLEVRIANRRATVLQAQEVAQRRAEAARERRLREAEHALNAVDRIVNGGALPDDKTMNEAARAVQGTPYAAALKASMATAGNRAAFGSLAPAQQDAALIEMRARMARDGTNERELELVRSFESIRAKTREAVEKDALAWGVASRLVPEAPAIRLDAGVQGLVQTVGQRVDLARTVQAKLGRAVSPLLVPEAQLVGEQIAALPLDQRKGFVRTLAGALPPEQQRALAVQLKDKDGALAMAMHAASLPRTGGADPVELILRGQDAVRAGRIKEDDAQTKLQRAKIARQLDAIPWPTPKARDAAAEAAGMVLDGLRDQKGGSGSETKALQIAVGEVVDWGDGKTLAPPGWNEYRFETAMRKLSAATLARQAAGPLTLNGQAIEPATLLRALPSAKLMPYGPGSYAIDAGGVVLANGRPFVLRVED